MTRPLTPRTLIYRYFGLFFAVTLIFEASPAFGESSKNTSQDPRDFAGAFQYDGELDQGRAIIRQAFEDALEQVPALFRPLVRKRMTSRDYMVRSFRIRVREDRVGFRAVSYKVMSVTTRQGETEIVRKGRRGDTTALQQFRDGHYEITLTNRRGVMHNRFTFLDDGQTLRCETTFTSRYLEQPISFELDYRRVQRQRRRARPRASTKSQRNSRRRAQAKVRGAKSVPRATPSDESPPQETPAKSPPRAAPDTSAPVKGLQKAHPRLVPVPWRSRLFPRPILVKPRRLVQPRVQPMGGVDMGDTERVAE